MTIKLLSLVFSIVAKLFVGISLEAGTNKALFSCDALLVPASNEMSTKSFVSEAQSFADSHRMIRSPSEQDSTVEEALLNKPTTPKLTDTIKKWIKEKLAKMTAYLRKFVEARRLSKQKKIDRKIEKAKRLIKERATKKTLLQKKITPDEYYKALGLDESLRGYSNTIEDRKLYPDLAKWYDYMEYYKAHTWDMTEVINHIKRKMRLDD
ncbi:hypothetical protein PsorP6_014705 [Peronosclerospora sorghi]|uniref:Uncharacterized protein n=1 Tax=Peronosclerospora sorghi TaxID=230839 RepID=A0ACC0VT57_9STRA|nr:hypothetical protein PsorP6_014705 [Peronosclerospora sorghi]